MIVASSSWIPVCHQDKMSVYAEYLLLSSKRRDEEFPLSAPALSIDSFPVRSSSGCYEAEVWFVRIAPVPVSKYLVKVAFITVVLWISMSESIRSARAQISSAPAGGGVSQQYITCSCQGLLESCQSAASAEVCPPSSIGGSCTDLEHVCMSSFWAL